MQRMLDVCNSPRMVGGSLVRPPWQERDGGGKKRAFEASSTSCGTTVSLGIPGVETAQDGSPEVRIVPSLAQLTSAKYVK